MSGVTPEQGGEINREAAETTIPNRNQLRARIQQPSESYSEIGGDDTVLLGVGECFPEIYT